MNEDEGQLVLLKIDKKCCPPRIHYSVTITLNMRWRAFLCGVKVPCATPLVSRTSLLLSTIEALKCFLLTLDKASVCEGNHDGKSK